MRKEGGYCREFSYNEVRKSRNFKKSHNDDGSLLDIDKTLPGQFYGIKYNNYDRLLLYEFPRQKLG